MGKTDQDIQSRNQLASTKSIKMSPFLFFTLLIVASSGFEVNQKAAAGYENRRPANLSKKLIPANLREKLIRDKLPKPLPSKPVVTKESGPFKAFECDCNSGNPVTNSNARCECGEAAPPPPNPGTCSCDWPDHLTSNNCAPGYEACMCISFECYCTCKLIGDCTGIGNC